MKNWLFIFKDPSNGISLEKIIEVILQKSKQNTNYALVGLEVYLRYRNVINDIYYETYEVKIFANEQFRD